MSAGWRRWCAAIFLAASPALAQQPQVVPGLATGSIEGRVLDALTGEPIAKAEVDLNGAEQTDLTAGTDANGGFAFRGLPAGTYWVDARRPGYTSPLASPPPIALSSGEGKSGIDIRLFPPGSIGGKVVDEFGDPVANCEVNALQPRSQGGRRGMRVAGSADANNRGEYRIAALEKGRYYVSARCSGEVEEPHPLTPANDPRRRTLVFAPQFYPGVPDANGATRLKVAPGVETRGVDFQVRRVPGVTVRVRVDVADPALLQRVHVQLLPPSLDYYQGPAYGSGVDRHTGELQVGPVIPGSYVLVAQTSGDGPLYHAQLPLEAGATPPDPIRLVLSPAAKMSGTLQVEGNNPPALDSLLVMIEPLGGFVFARPAARVDKEGAFTLADITPGRWRLSLSVSGVPYVKSLSIGDRDVSPYGFDLAQGAAGPIRVVASTGTGQVEATVSGGSAGSGAVSFLLAPADPERFESGHVRLGGAGSGGQATIYGVVPGRYRLFAFDGNVRWTLQQLEEVLKALEGRSELVEVGEGETVRATAERIKTSQLAEAIEEAQ